jgi:protein-disulfide isomerase
MKKQASFVLSRSILAIGVLALVAACSKKVAQPSAKPADLVPAARTSAIMDKSGQPSGQEGSLPAGIDVGKLDAPQRKVFDQVVGREPSACGKGHSLLHSVQHDGACRASFYAVRYVARLAATGFSETDIAVKLEQRFHAPRVSYIDVSQAPSKGSPSGKVTIVEFADYQCDHCKQAQPLIHQILREYSGEVTFYYKHFPLSGHIGALNAAMGAVAAQNQGKFWQYSDKVWESSDNLVPAVLESIAKEIGLDFSRWFSEVGSQEVREHIKRDKVEGSDLEIRSTPAIFINRRRYADALDLPSLKDWIDEELGR